MIIRDTIAVDVDDTLHHNQACIQQVAAEHGYHFELSDLVDWPSLVELCGGLASFLVILSETFHRQHDDPEWSPLFEGARETLQHLSDQGFKIHYFTDRPPEHVDTTPRWLAGHGFPQVENTHVCRDKRDDIIALGVDRILGIIDDRPRTMDWAHNKMGIPHVLSLRFPHNRSMVDMEWVHMGDNWAELRLALDKTILMPANGI